MAEYINRGTAIAKLTALQVIGPNTTLTDAKRLLADISATDVAPVVHGDWILRHIGAGHYWECSVCHTNPCIYVTEHTKFCPNCGAKMDGGAEFGDDDDEMDS